MGTTNLDILHLGSDTSTALLLGSGAASSSTATTTSSAGNFLQLYLASTHTSGDVRGIYNRLYLSGAGGAGESLRSFTTVNNVAASTAHGAHLSLSLGTTGSVTGQGIATRSTLHIPNVAMSGGTYAAAQSELYADGSTSDISGTTMHSIHRFLLDGNATGRNRSTNVFEFVQLSTGSGKMLQSATGAGASKSLRVIVNGTVMYIPLASASDPHTLGNTSIGGTLNVTSTFTVATNKLSVAADTGVMTLANGATIDNNADAAVLNLTETTVRVTGILDVTGNSTQASVDVGGGFTTGTGSGLTIAATGALSTNGAIITESTLASGNNGANGHAGGLTINNGVNPGAASFAVAGATGIVTMAGGATLDNNTDTGILNITETLVKVTGNLEVTGSITYDTLSVGGGFVTGTGSGMSVDATGALSTNGAILTESSLTSGNIGANGHAGTLTIYNGANPGQASFSIAGATGIVTLDGGATIDNNADANVLNITETTVRVTGALDITGNSTLASIDVGGGFVTGTGSGLTIDATGALSTNGAIVSESTLTSGNNGANGHVGGLTINTGANPGAASFAVAGATGIVTLAGGATIDNNTDTGILNLTETLVKATGNLEVTGTSTLTGVATATAGFTGYGVYTDTADGTIPAYRLAMLDGSGDTVVATAGALTIIGANADNASRAGTDPINLAYGKCTVVAAEPITAGAQLKVADNGRVACLNNSAKAAGTIKQSSAGAAFGNQPANDSVTVVSADAGDTTQTVTIIGTTNGGVVVVTENIALNGVTPVASTKVDWGEILAVKLSASCAGTVTVTETSGGLTVTTITTGNTSKGVDTVTAASQGCHNTIPSVTGSDTTVKIIGVQYTATDGSTVAYQAVAANNTTAAPFAAAALLVTEVYSGDLEGTRTVTIKTSATEDDENVKVGKALATAAAAANVAAIINP